MKSPARTVEQMLDGGDRRSIGQVTKIVTRARRDPSVIPDVVAALRSSRPLVAMRAADALEKISRRTPTCLAPYRRQVISVAVHTKDPVVRWNLIQCFPRVPHSRPVLRRLVRRLEVWYLNDRSAIVRVAALEACVALASGDEMLDVLSRRLVADALTAPSAAVRARARRLRRQLTESQRRA